jgi:hypothetical protein
MSHIALSSSAINTLTYASPCLGEVRYGIRFLKAEKNCYYSCAITADMAYLFGVFARHNPESCPMTNKESKSIVASMDKKIDEAMPKNGIKKMHGFYFSVLEHEWTIIVEAEDAHSVEKFCIESGIAAFSTIKIVPLTDWKAALNKIKGG